MYIDQRQVNAVGLGIGELKLVGALLGSKLVLRVLSSSIEAAHGTSTLKRARNGHAEMIRHINTSLLHLVMTTMARQMQL